MFALGCIQAQSCHTDRCPTGVATQDPSRWRKLDVPDKATRVHNFHAHTLKAVSYTHLDVYKRQAPRARCPVRGCRTPSPSAPIRHASAERRPC